MSKKNRGSALIVMLLALLLFTLLGAAALQMGRMELAQGWAQAQQLRAGYLAESGVELAAGWFARPAQFGGRMGRPAGPCPAAAHAGELFVPRCRREDDAGGHWFSFLTDDGTSQFQGTREQPDGLITIPASSLLPAVWSGGGEVMLEVRVFGPLGRGAVCTVAAIVWRAGVAHEAVQVEFAEAGVPVVEGRPVVTVLPGSWRQGVGGW